MSWFASFVVVGFALLGFIGGGAVGPAAARLLAAGAEPGFRKAIVASWGTVLLIASRSAWTPVLVTPSY